MRFSLAIVGVCGLIVGLSTWFVVKLQRAEIEQSKIEFDSYKVEVGGKIAAADAAGKAAQAAAAIANAETAKANERTALLEQETIRLKIAAAWRGISKEQSELIVSALEGQTFNLFVYGMRAENDPEAHVLWDEIVGALRGTKLKLVPATVLASGLGISVAGEPGPDLDTLKDAFAKAGIILLESSKLTPQKGLELHIGTKLPPN